MERYDPKTIEPKWQRVWAEEGTWEVANDDPGDRPSAYVLEMLPYPSGEPHIGHLKNYSLGDAVAHYWRRRGHRVLHPMGYDAFGLPAENEAIKSGRHPRESTNAFIAEFQRQFRQWGISIDWTRELATSDPEYYRWTQWIFLRLYERGLAYRKEAAVKWCPKDATVLANEQVIDGHCERCGSPVEVRQLEQWFFRITDYADRLLDDMQHIAWPRHVVTMQENWIGRSEGAEVVFRCEELGIDYPVFTTRPDTLFGATFFVMAPEHPDVFRLNDSPEVHEYVNRALTESAEERGDEHKEKTGVALGRTVTNPVTGEQIPMFVADYVLMEYGTGAIMAVPAHDQRDYEFAERFGLEIRPVVAPADGEPGAEGEAFVAHSDNEALINSGSFTGMPAPEAKGAITAWLEERGPRAGHRELPPARLAALTPALLGLPDSDGLLRAGRAGAGARRPAAGGAARDRGLHPAGPLAPGGRRGLGAHHLPPLRRRGPARDRHDGHLRRLVLVLPALLRSPQPGRALGSRRGEPLDAGRPVHRRRRARDPAPDVRPLLRQGAGGHGSARRTGALRAAVHPGHDHPRRGEDVQVEGQRRSRPPTTSSATARTPRAATSSSSAHPARTPTGRTRASAGCTASSRGCGPWPRRPRRPAGR